MLQELFCLNYTSKPSCTLKLDSDGMKTHHLQYGEMMVSIKMQPRLASLLYLAIYPSICSLSLLLNALVHMYIPCM